MANTNPDELRKMIDDLSKKLEENKKSNEEQLASNKKLIEEIESLRQKVIPQGASSRGKTSSFFQTARKGVMAIGVAISLMWVANHEFNPPVHPQVTTSISKIETKAEATDAKTTILVTINNVKNDLEDVQESLTSDPIDGGGIVKSLNSIVESLQKLSKMKIECPEDIKQELSKLIPESEELIKWIAANSKELTRSDARLVKHSTKIGKFLNKFAKFCQAN